MGIKKMYRRLKKLKLIEDFKIDKDGISIKPIKAADHIDLHIDFRQEFLCVPAEKPHYECPYCLFRISEFEFLNIKYDLRCPRCGVRHLSKFVKINKEKEMKRIPINLERETVEELVRLLKDMAPIDKREKENVDKAIFVFHKALKDDDPYKTKMMALDNLLEDWEWLKDLVKETVEAWEKLPEGHYAPNEIAIWLAHDMKPALDKLREYKNKK